MSRTISIREIEVSIDSYKELYMEVMEQIREIHNDKLDFILNTKPVMTTIEFLDGNSMDSEVFNFTHDNGEIEHFETKEDYIEFVFDALIKNCNADLKYYQDKLLELENMKYNSI